MIWSSVSTFSDIIRKAAELYSEKIAFKDQRRELSFLEYEAEVNQLASALYANGVLPGSRIAVFSQGRIEVAVILGLCKAGFVPVPLNWRMAVDEVALLLQDCEPSVFFVEDRYMTSIGSIESLPRDCAVVCIGKPAHGVDHYSELLQEGTGDFDFEVKPEDPACIIYTSGTTGRPKGAVLTHRGVALNCQDSSLQTIKFRPDDVTLMVMPLFHVGGVWYYLFPSFASGCLTLIRDRFDPDDVITTCLEENVTNIHVVPTMLGELLDRPDFPLAATHLRLIVYAGSSMPIDLLRRSMAKLGSCGFAQAYGSTEAGIISALDVRSHKLALEDSSRANLLRSCGKPLSGTDVRIDRASQNSDDPVGEILVKSNKLMGLYWQLPEATSERFEQGWLKTGDLGYFDPDGYLYIVDRKNDLVISGGENIYPFEVEEVLRSHPDVCEASVFGIPDRKWVERLVAAVVLSSNSELSAQALIDHTRLSLPGYKTPKAIFFVESLPKSPVGKVLRKSLRETFSKV